MIGPPRTFPSLKLRAVRLPLWQIHLRRSQDLFIHPTAIRLRCSLAIIRRVGHRVASFRFSRPVEDSRKPLLLRSMVSHQSPAGPPTENEFISAKLKALALRFMRSMSRRIELKR